MNGISRSTCLRKRCVQTTARHPGAVKRSQQKTPNHKRVLKKRDIRTSFLRTPVAPVLNPPPAAPQQPAAAVPTLLPPAVALPADSAAAALQAAPLVAISLGEACNTTTTAVDGSSRLAGEPAVASTASAVDALTATDSVLGFSSTSSSSSASSSDDEESLWGAQDGLNSLAALDRALNGLILAPASASSSSSKASSSAAKASSSGKSSSSKSKSSSKRSSSSSGGTAAAAGPALVSIHCESDWERELAAAAANQQLVVVKVEAAQSLMRSSSCIDPTLRFQTHNILPTELNTYAPHTELLSSFRLLGNSASAAPATFTSAYDFSPASMRSSAGGAVVAAAAASSNPACQLDSPVHHWYKQLAGQYASSGSSSSKLRFLSLQSDGLRAKALCRRLGVAAPLSVLLVEPASGRQVLQVVGNKVEQELPSALLYFGDVDAHGVAPSQLLPQLSSKEQLDAHTSSADVCVVAFHMHAAPPCVQSYSRLFEAAQGSAGSAPFAVMDVDSSEECTALSNELGLQRLPMYVVYKNGLEVHRLARSSERKQLPELLQQLLGGAAAEAAVAAA